MSSTIVLKVGAHISIAKKKGIYSWTFMRNIISPVTPTEEMLVKMLLFNKAKEDSDLLKIIKAATKKFGRVISILDKNPQHHLGESYIVTILRDSPPLPDAPYMTITAYITPDDEVAFTWGHYDLPSTSLGECK